MSNKLLADRDCAVLSLGSGDRAAGGGLRCHGRETRASLHVLEFGAEGTRTHATTQKVRLKRKSKITEGPLTTRRNNRKVAEGRASLVVDTPIKDRPFPA